MVMYDFGNGPELAVFQSTAIANLGANSSIEAAVFMNDSNAGPKITALRSIGSWTDFGYPEVDHHRAFFFNPKDRSYLAPMVGWKYHVSFSKSTPLVFTMVMQLSCFQKQGNMLF